MIHGTRPSGPWDSRRPAPPICSAANSRPPPRSCSTRPCPVAGNSSRMNPGPTPNGWAGWRAPRMTPEYCPGLTEWSACAPSSGSQPAFQPDVGAAWRNVAAVDLGTGTADAGCSRGRTRQHHPQVPPAGERIRSAHSRAPVLPTAAHAFARGARGGVFTTSTSTSARTAAASCRVLPGQLQDQPADLRRCRRASESRWNNRSLASSQRKCVPQEQQPLKGLRAERIAIPNTSEGAQSGS